MYVYTVISFKGEILLAIPLSLLLVDILLAAAAAAK